MRRACRIAVLSLIGVAVTAGAGAGEPAPANPGAASATSTNPATSAPGKPESNPLLSLQSRVADLENRRRDPLTERVMWAAVMLVGVAFAVAWWKVRQAETLERTVAAMYQAAQSAKTDPTPALQQFLTRLEAAAGQIRETTSRAEDALRAIDSKLAQTSQRMTDIAKRVEGVEAKVDGKP